MNAKNFIHALHERTRIEKQKTICVHSRLFVACFVLLLLAVSGFAQPAPRIVLIAADGLTLDDVQDAASPHLADWAAHGAIALLNQAAKEGRVLSRRNLTGDAPQIRSVVVDLTRPDTANKDRLMDDPLADYAAVNAHEEADLVIIHAGELARIEAEQQRGALTANAYIVARQNALRRLNILVYLLRRSPPNRPTDLLLIAGPPLDFPMKEKPTRLFPVLASGPDFPPGLLVSATTRTAGLVANADFAPTIAALIHAPVPAGNSGRPIRTVQDKASGEERLAIAVRIDYVAELNGKALTSVGIPLFGLCAALVTAGLLLRRGRPHRARVFAPACVFTLNAGAAMLLAPLLVPPTLWEYGLRIAAWMLGLTLACYILARVTQIAPPLWAALFTITLVAGDIVTGQNLLKGSMLSGYPLSGIRYYGVGNEYLGAVIGFALAGSFALLDNRRIPFPLPDAAKHIRYGMILLWAVLAFLLGWPALGANAGSLIVTGAGFGVGGVILRGGRPTWRTGAISALTGLLLAFAFSALDAVFARREASHFGAVMQTAAGGRGAGYLLVIALRKIGMNLHLLISPYFLAGAGMIVLVILLTRRVLGADLQHLWQRHIGLAQGQKALTAAGVASLLFKDSGVVTALFVAGSAWLIVFWFLLAEKVE